VEVLDAEGKAVLVVTFREAVLIEGSRKARA
jgi:hypothetical protein